MHYVYSYHLAFRLWYVGLSVCSLTNYSKRYEQIALKVCGGTWSVW